MPNEITGIEYFSMLIMLSVKSCSPWKSAGQYMSPLFLRRRPKKVPTKQDNNTQTIAFVFRLLTPVRGLT